MNTRSRKSVIALLVFAFFAPLAASAATTPVLGSAASYAILADTYTSTMPGTTVNGDIGFNTGPSVVPSGVHTNFGSGASFTTAVADMNTALSALNAEPCTFTFAPGTVDLATDATHGTVGVYAPGVYCVPSIAASVTIGAAGITLNGSGTYIFRFNRSLVTAPASAVTLAGGASACDIFWVPVDNAIVSILGENSTFAGTIIGTQRLDLRNNVTMVGGAFLPAGTVSTNVDDTITPPASCTPPTPPVVDPPVVVPPVVPPVVVPPVEPPTITPPVPPITVVTSIEEPKTPNTGAGGEMIYTALILLFSALTAVVGSLYLKRD